jgi:diguanylate cyclase
MDKLVYIAVGVAIIALGVMAVFLRRKTPDTATPKGGAGSRDKKPVSEADIRIDRSADLIREILMRLADSIRRLGGAAENSASTLVEIRNHLSTRPVPPPLEEAQSFLMTEIDRVITTNSSLRDELARAREELAEQQRQIENLQTAVRIDSLTQIGNRSYLDEHLQEAVERLKRYHERFSLIMIDVDHFKQINDTYGHPSGDRILKGLALKLKAGIRGTDSLARYGGEEFAVVLPKTEEEDARYVAEEIREGVEFSKFNLSGKEVRITVSAGVASSQENDTAESITKRADNALYRAKNSGRNRVELNGSDEPEKTV